MGARNSSSFQNGMNQQSQDFAAGLQSKRTEMMMNAIRDLMGMSNTVLGQNPYENFLIEKQQKQPSGWGGIAGAGIGGLGGFAASGGNPFVALQGANLGYNVGSAF